MTEWRNRARITLVWVLTAGLPLAASASDDVTPAAPSTYSDPPSFRQDVLPILTKSGCNMGACHGKLAGQNGFKLSLRAYAPEMDYPWLTADLAARRVDYAFPGQSLLLRKAAGLVPHEGRKRFDVDSPEYRTLLKWIAARAPGPDAKESDAARLEISPGSRELRVGESQQLVARAFYEDGRMRDVTWLAQVVSNDETTVKVTPQGVVTSLRPGEAAVRVHFQGQVAVVTVTTPYANDVSASDFASRNNFIDDHVFAKLKALRVPPSPGCDDAAFIRRASLDATGTLPSAAEVRAFVNDPSPDKRARLIDDLLDRPEWVDYWTLQLADLLQNRKERDHDVRGTKGVRAFHAWLHNQVAANRPWDQLARDVLTATGDSTDAPQIGYFVTTIGESREVEKSEVADAVAQSFLGTRIGCAKCHNHPLEKYTQDDYYHFAAFFARVGLNRGDATDKPTVLALGTAEQQQAIRQIARLEKSIREAETEAKGKQGDEAKKAAEKVEQQRKQLADARRRAEEQAKRPATVNQPRTNQQLGPQPLDRSKPAIGPGDDPRRALAAWITDPTNEQFAGAMVNRLWRHFMGVGMVEPVDDLRSSNPPSNPALWAAMRQDFVAHGYDLRHVMRTILNSRAYQLSSATLAGNEGDGRFYSRYYVRRLPAEVLLDAISAATDVPDKYPGYPVGTRAVQLPEPGVNSYFLSLFGRSERVTACACERSGDVTLPQLLNLNNGNELLDKIRAADGRLATLLKAQTDDGAALDELFLATVCRKPTAQEVDAVKELVKSGDGREDVYRDLFWALLNSKEFAFNH